jgi:glycosyltransferase involved in cell wall biosynthesis
VRAIATSHDPRRPELKQPESLSLGQHNIALIGDYQPRRCGIATFTTDLTQALAEESPESSCFVVAMNDVLEGYRYPDQVRFEVNDKSLVDYQLAADFLNVSQVDVVCVQHEFGIYGGRFGSHILPLLRDLRIPIVTTLHTVLKDPEPGQKTIVEEMAQVSDRMVVMSDKARRMLREVYDIPEQKVVLIHHGIPDLPFIDPNYFKDQFGVEGRKVLLTFGLLSPAKGIEYMIDALPEIVRKHPDVTYIVLGATHPNVKREQGEAYRLSLQRQARQLGVEKNVVFHNRFVDLKELCEFLGVADLYVTPYLGQEQIVSGTLAYALGAGKATISTPYWYAEEMLADGRGRIVPFRDSNALAAQAIDLLDHDVERHAMRKRAYSYCREMVWKEVARQYLHVFTEVEKTRRDDPARSFRTLSLHRTSLEMPRPRFDHLRRLTDDVGILQHAKYIVPNRAHGYSIDDNARALIAVLMARDVGADRNQLRDLDCRYLSFVFHALNPRTDRFRNFMSYDRKWLEEQGSDDSHGRAVWSLGTTVALGEKELSDVALAIFKPAATALLGTTSPRAWAFGLVGIHAYLRRFGGDSEMRRLREKLAQRLYDLYESNARDDWPWIEDVVTYDNGKIPQALMMSGVWLQRGEMTDAGLRSLDWLMRIQTDAKGHFIPVGNQGWYTRDGRRARFDQQPLEAQSIVEACMEAYSVTRDERWIDEARRSLDWFFGRNDMETPLYDYKTGGCCDGLGADGANRNQGAESTLACLLAVLRMYSHDHLEDEAVTPADVVSETPEGSQHA